MHNFKLVIEYDGTDFLGWQSQARGRTVQGEVEAVLRQVLQEDISVIGAGRTDTGVHARGQVASVRTKSGIEPQRLRAALNGLLPADIRVRSAENVPELFHARFDARERCYRYHTSLRPVAIGRAYVWHVPFPLDTSLMRSTAALILGQHDFGAFSKTGSGNGNFRCDVRASAWKEMEDRLVYEIRSDRFVRGMVRALVGTMVDVGRGHISVEEFGEILRSKDRTKAGMAAPPCGLVLEEVLY
jgi:tRNA pseudouridine38-40 synthase